MQHQLKKAGLVVTVRGVRRSVQHSTKPKHYKQHRWMSRDAFSAASISDAHKRPPLAIIIISSVIQSVLEDT